MAKAQGSGKARHLSLIARVTVAVVVIAWVLHGQDWAKLWQVIRQLSVWSFLLGLAIYVAAQVTVACRWWLLLRAQAIHITVRTAIGLYFLGLLFNNLMPGSVGGDLFKAWYITKHTDKKVAGALSVVVDRVIGLAGLILMATVAYLMFVRGPLGGAPGAQPSAAGRWLAHHRNLLLWLAAGILAVLGGLLAYPATRARLLPHIKRILHRCALVMTGIKDAIVIYCRRPFTLLAAVVLTLFAQSVAVVAFWPLGRNLGIEAGLHYYFVIFPVAWVVSALPISVAGLGLLEAGVVGMFAQLAGTAAEKALALAFCQRLIWTVTSLPGAVVHLFGAHLPKDICLDGPTGVR